MMQIETDCVVEIGDCSWKS